MCGYLYIKYFMIWHFLAVPKKYLYINLCMQKIFIFFIFYIYKIYAKNAKPNIKTLIIFNK